MQNKQTYNTGSILGSMMQNKQTYNTGMYSMMRKEILVLAI
jgi:hypothetical protein